MFKWATFREILLASSGHDGRSISRNLAHLNILVHDMIDLLYYVVRYKLYHFHRKMNVPYLEVLSKTLQV